MPRFTVIVPAHKVQASLRKCLESVLSQSYGDLEVIAVDDGSPGGSGPALDACAARDRRVVPLHLPGCSGVGGARNAGLARASGDYLLFLDGDDVLVPGTLQAVADRIEKTGEPDVIVYGFAHTDRRGRPVRRDDAGLLSEEGPVPFPPCGRPGLLHHPAAARSRAYRREFVERNGFAFPPGPGPDTAWGCPVLVCARTIATLDRVCVHSRERRRGDIRSTPGRKHVDVFGQYHRVMAFVESRPGVRIRRPAAVLRRLSGRAAGGFTASGRTLRVVGTAYLRRARDRYRRHRGLAAGAPGWLRGALTRASGHRVHRARLAARTLRAALGRGAATAYRTLTRAALRARDGFQLRLPAGPGLAVFTAGGAAFPAASPGAIGTTVREFASHVRAAWTAGLRRRHGLPPEVRRLLRQDAAGYWTAPARTAYPAQGGSSGKRPDAGPLHARLSASEALPFTTAGFALREHRTAAHRVASAPPVRETEGSGYSLSVHRHSSVRERAFPTGYTTLAYSSPRSDVLRRATESDVAALREELGVPVGCTAVLYAPAHRDHRRSRRPGPDLERVRRLLGPRFVVLTHPEATGRHSVEALCLAADALVTGFSSLMFDYASLDRPIVVYAGDWEAYEAARGTYVDLRSCPPGPIVRTEDELIGVFASGQWRGSRSAQLRAAFRTRFCPYDDGRTSGRVPRPDGPAAVPFDERHPVPVAAPVPPPYPSHVHR